MRYRLGRVLQILGMLIAPTGMVGNVVDPANVSEKHVLGAACIGVAVFLVGRAVQGTPTGGG